MTLEFKQGGETNKETLLGRLEDQDVMLKIQGGCVSWLVNLLGIRCSGSLCRGQVAPIVQHIVISNGLGGIDASDIVAATSTLLASMQLQKVSFIFCNQFSKLKTRLRSNKIKSEKSSWISSVRHRIK